MVICVYFYQLKKEISYHLIIIYFRESLTGQFSSIKSLKREKVPVVVTLQVSTDMAEALRKGKSSLIEITQDLSVKLEPLHPNTVNPQLQRFFMVKISNVTDTERIISQLRQCQGIEAAYVKPPDELP